MNSLTSCEKKTGDGRREGIITHELGCFPLGVVGVQVFLQLQHTKLQSLQQATRDQLQARQDTTYITATTVRACTHCDLTCETRACTHARQKEQPHRLCVQQHSGTLGV